MFKTEELRVQDRWLIGKISSVLVKLSLTTTIKREKSGPCLGQTCSRTLCFCRNHWSSCWLSLVLCCTFRLSKTCDEKFVWVEIFCSATGYIYHHQDFEQITFCRISGVHIVDRPIRDKNFMNVYNWLKNELSWHNFDKFYFLYKYSQPICDVMQKTYNLELVLGCKFWVYWLVKKQWQ